MKPKSRHLVGKGLARGAGAGGFMKIGLRSMASVALLATAIVFGACTTPMVGAPEVRYSYDPQFGFQQAKTYRWAETGSPYGYDPLLEANVRFLADRLLESKGLTSKADAPALRISIRYEATGYGHELRSLSLAVARTDTNALVWRGVSTGPIRSDAASTDLPAAIQAMLANFPPKPDSVPAQSGQ
jgi:Domain of unknown function (DUF4136)